MICLYQILYYKNINTVNYDVVAPRALIAAHAPVKVWLPESVGVWKSTKRTLKVWRWGLPEGRHGKESREGVRPAYRASRAGLFVSECDRLRRFVCFVDDDWRRRMKPGL